MKRSAASRPSWLSEGILPEAACDALVAYMHKKGLVMTRRPMGVCECDFFRPIEAPGYKGAMELACETCCAVCPRCHEQSVDLTHGGAHWPEPTCYACACGENCTATSAAESSNDDDEA